MTTKAISEIRSVLNGINGVLNEFSHPKPKPYDKSEFENWPKLLGRDWTQVQQSCESCGSYSGWGFLVRDIDWYNICPAKYNTSKREGKTVWIKETDPERVKAGGEWRSESGEDGSLCLACFDGYAAAAGMDYEITTLWFNGLRQSFEVKLPKGIEVKKFDRKTMYDKNAELKAEIRHPDYPGDQGWTDAEDGKTKRQEANRRKFSLVSLRKGK